MAIRADFKEVEGPLNRLLVYGQTFDQFDCEKWPHYKNREDFDRIFRLSSEEQIAYEQLYSNGRGCAGSMASMMSGGFNDVRIFPTLRSYVAAFEGSWIYQTKELRAQLAEVAALGQKYGKQPWAVRAMADLFEKQIEMLEASAVVLTQLKNTPLYRREGGEPDSLPPALPAAAPSGHGGFIIKFVACILTLVLAIVAFNYLGFLVGILFVIFTAICVPLLLGFSASADKLSGKDLAAIYKSGVDKLPSALKSFGKAKSKP